MYEAFDGHGFEIAFEMVPPRRAAVDPTRGACDDGGRFQGAR
jgi:hypothetical protein